ncbi:hypothetical protein BW731_02650 [Vagococcus martis]|uniref:Uncharacterized protein n=1 Tax=Vagococcus martis TaxID=1768210 RepID=A0A1V4DF88_9ENTE|nr:hypothetical protein [Vagococcus martis]OPF87187.1 hypothetical protein BW731_02650 [Vagococcus martis]
MNYYGYSLLAMYYARNVEGSYATAKAILWQEIKYDGEYEDILREGIKQAKDIIDNEKEIDWNPSKISKMCGITEGRTKNDRLYFYTEQFISLKKVELRIGGIDMVESLENNM